MESNGCGSGYGMGMQVNFAGIPPENGIAVTKEAGGSTAAPADVSRRRKPVMKKKKGFIKRKRMSDIDDAFAPPPLPSNIIERGGKMTFMFHKQLHNTDVSNVGRIVLPKHSAEAHLPVLFNNDSIILSMNDMDSGDVWSFKFRYWPNNRSRMYVLEGTGPFTKKHRLEAGNYMLLYHDLVNHSYVIRGVRVYEDEEHEKEETEVERIKPMKKDADLINQPILGGNGGLEFDMFDLPNQPTNMDSLSLMNDNSYFSDILNSFSSWDDEFMINSNYPPDQQQLTSFENLSSEDLSKV